jgi:hypothetical protein
MLRQEKRKMNSDWLEMNMTGSLRYKRRGSYSEEASRMIEKSMKLKGRMQLKRRLFKGN